LYCVNLTTEYTTVNYLKWFLISQTLRCLVLVASATTPEHELALAPTSGPEVIIAVSVGQCRHLDRLSASDFRNPDDHENCRPTCEAIEGDVCADAELSCA